MLAKVRAHLSVDHFFARLRASRSASVEREIHKVFAKTPKGKKIKKKKKESLKEKLLAFFFVRVN